MWWAGSFAAVALVAGLSYCCTARVVLWFVTVAGASATTVALANGGTPDQVAGVMFLAAGLSAAGWALGRSARVRGARRRAFAAYASGAAAVPGLAAEAERHRLAADLHDTAAHRLTGIMIGASSALHVRDERLTAEAVAHAVREGRLVVAELTRLTALDARADHAHLADLDTLVAGWPEQDVSYRRDAEDAPPPIAALAVRIVREALTNSRRHAPGVPVEVLVRGHGGRLVVTVTDQGRGGAFDAGSGCGLAVLRAEAAAAGGSLEAGPVAGGWRVRAVLPLGDGGPRRARWWSEHVRNWAPVVLGVGIPVGGLMVPDPGDVPLLAKELALLVPLLILHALPLRWHVARPIPALAVTLSLYPLIELARVSGWPITPGGDLVLWCGWIELIMVYGIGLARGPRGVLAPLAVSSTMGAALAWGPGITGNRFAAWVVLSAFVLVPVGIAWAAGVLLAARRARRRDGAAARHGRLRERAALAERARVAARLRATALRHAEALVAASDDLPVVAARSRAALNALRDLLGELRRPAADDPPPCLAGIDALAVRRGVLVTSVGERRQLHGAVEATAFWAARELLGHDAPLTVTYLPEGVELSAPAGRVTRRLRAVAEAAGGAVSARGAQVRVWLPA
ncbi:sensor histidine kinase [Nonomuraea endophytica]|uniref:histidine kinase n=1 Tax=Nonomuraea endophytica TaxID=714136 RepID=A0A7W7ZYT1_9ACTN|nr:ATP-binding protein [Nonomuraea endophytica]MBB5075949.1 signal transduction histidine kinase [Nonomuraea endophytica]